MSDTPTLITVSLAAIALGAGGLRVAQASLAKRNGNGSKNGRPKSGDLTPEEWVAKIDKSNFESEERLMADMRSLMEARTLVLVEKVTQPIVNEIRGLRNDLALWSRSNRRS